jgi:hypothetical protein
MSRKIIHDHNHDGIDRRGFLECMAWAGTGALCVLSGGVLKSYALSEMGQATKALTSADFSFVQISDSHIGFNKPANPDVSATLQAAIDKVNALSTPPSFILHTGDITQLSKPDEFDTAAQLLKGLKTDQIFYVPGEHDVLDGTGKLYRERHAVNSVGDGWYSVDLKGAHFVGLVNGVEPQSGWPRLPRPGTARMAREGSQECLEQHSNCRVRPHSVVVRLSGVGLGYRRQRPGPFLHEALRVGHGPQRPHSSNNAKGRGQRHFSHGVVDCFPAGRSWHARCITWARCSTS